MPQMFPSTHAFTTLALGLALCGLLTLPLLFAIPNPLGDPFLRELHNAGHFPIFAGVQGALLWLGRIARPDWRWPKLILVTAGLSFGLGLAIEVAQLFIERNTSLRDLWRNLLGITFASGLFLAAHKSGARGLGIALVVISVPLAFQALALQAHTQWQRNQSLPLLMDFNNEATLRHVSAAADARWAVVGAPPEWPPVGRPVARVVMPADTKWPGLMLHAPYPDWSDYQSLAFEVFHTGEAPVRIALNVYCITDGEPTMYYQAFTLEPGINDLRVPVVGSKGLNPQAVRNLLWYSISEAEGLVLYFDNIRLQ